MEVALPLKPSVEVRDEAICSVTTHSTFDGWVERYERWANDVYEKQDTPTPTKQQAHVLLSTHFRVLKEEYEVLEQKVPEAM